ncbi:citrate lyase holo-[acyl-carrier protein] synthase [Caballeronia sp. dw_19]|uniref:citrate lyase holo-[acyl-carrier protein] synthase n=1 Tax=Caballeronia sp. dw_19 TaxID=2719791 RepID=UPI001BD365C8|nr:citrate lyase holo-[acyl-carrier protein] synthase [Caballeronia sp. dw_19]
MDPIKCDAIESMVSLEKILAAREHRVARQAAALAKFGMSVVSVTIVMPGPVKGGRLARRAMEVALETLDALFDARRWLVQSRETLWAGTGPEALYVVDADPKTLKSVLIELEDHHSIGRLWDLDVIGVLEGGLSRKAFGYSPRRCLVCDRPARDCGRSQRHPTYELLALIEAMVTKYDSRS